MGFNGFIGIAFVMVNCKVQPNEGVGSNLKDEDVVNSQTDTNGVDEDDTFNKENDTFEEEKKKRKYLIN